MEYTTSMLQYTAKQEILDTLEFQKLNTPKTVFQMYQHIETKMEHWKF